MRSGAVLGALAEHEYWRDRPEVWTGRWSSLGRLAAGWIAYRERDPRRLWLDKTGEPRRVIDLRELQERRADVARIAAVQPECLERVATETLLHLEKKLACTELVWTHED